MTRDDMLERAEAYEGQAKALIEHARLSDRELLAEAANYVTLARFLREQAETASDL
jgi:regulator of protease activity HflC (stomatin/prohibitin superfamily)